MVVDTFTGTIENAIESVIRQLPGITGAVIVLVVGWLLGKRIGLSVSNFCHRNDIGSWFEDTPIAPLFGDDNGGLPEVLGAVVKYYVVIFAVFVAVDVAAFQQLRPWLQTLVVYVTKVLAGAVIIVLGLVVADYAVRRTRESDVVRESEYSGWIPALERAVLYGIVVIVGLDMAGLNLKIVYMIVDGITSAIGLGIVVALALGLGVAAGLLAKDYVDRELTDRGETTEN